MERELRIEHREHILSREHGLRVGSDRVAGKKFSHEIGIPIAAGLIVGEALVGVGNALIKVFFASPKEETAARLSECASSLSQLM